MIERCQGLIHRYRLKIKLIWILIQVNRRISFPNSIYLRQRSWWDGSTSFHNSPTCSVVCRSVLGKVFFPSIAFLLFIHHVHDRKTYPSSINPLALSCLALSETSVDINSFLLLHLYLLWHCMCFYVVYPTELTLMKLHDSILLSLSPITNLLPYEDHFFPSLNIYSINLSWRINHSYKGLGYGSGGTGINSVCSWTMLFHILFIWTSCIPSFLFAILQSHCLTQ
jgi:hypothetical protein